MSNSKRGEIFTLIATAVVILIGITTFITTTFLNKNNKKLTYQSRAATRCDRLCLLNGGTNEECCYEEQPTSAPVPQPTSPPSQEDPNLKCFGGYNGYGEPCGGGSQGNQVAAAGGGITPQPTQPTSSDTTVIPGLPPEPPKGSENTNKPGDFNSWKCAGGGNCDKCGKYNFWDAGCDRFVAQKGTDDAPYAAHYLWEKQKEELTRQLAAQQTTTISNTSANAGGGLSYIDALNNYNKCLSKNKHFGPEDAEAVCGAKPATPQKDGNGYKLVVANAQSTLPQEVVPTITQGKPPEFLDTDGRYKPVYLLSKEAREKVEGIYGKIPGAGDTSWNCSGYGQNCDKCGWAGWYDAGCYQRNYLADPSKPISQNNYVRLGSDGTPDAKASWQRTAIDECGGINNVQNYSGGNVVCKPKEVYLESPDGKHIDLIPKSERRQAEQECGKGNYILVPGIDYYTCKDNLPQPTQVPVSQQLAQQGVFSADACKLMQRQKDGKCFPAGTGPDGKEYFQYMPEDEYQKALAEQQVKQKELEQKSAFQCERMCEEKDAGRCVVGTDGYSHCVTQSSGGQALITYNKKTECGGRWQKSCVVDDNEYNNASPYCSTGLKPGVGGLCLPDESYEKAQAVGGFLKNQTDLKQEDILKILSANLTDQKSYEYLPEIQKQFCSGCAGGECLFSDAKNQFACVSQYDIESTYRADNKYGTQGEFAGSCNSTFGLFKGCNGSNLVCNSNDKCQFTEEGKRLAALNAANKNGTIKSGDAQILNLGYLSGVKTQELAGNKELAKAGACAKTGYNWYNGSCWECVDSGSGSYDQAATDNCINPVLQKYESAGQGCRGSGGYCGEGTGGGDSDCPGGFSCRSNPKEGETKRNGLGFIWDTTVKVVGLGKSCIDGGTSQCADGLRCWNYKCQDVTILAHTDEFKKGTWATAADKANIPVLSGLASWVSSSINTDYAKAAEIRAAKAFKQIDELKKNENVDDEKIKNLGTRIFDQLDGAAKGKLANMLYTSEKQKGNIKENGGWEEFAGNVFRAGNDFGTFMTAYGGDHNGKSTAFLDYAKASVEIDAKVKSGKISGLEGYLNYAGAAAPVGFQAGQVAADVLTLGFTGLGAKAARGLETAAIKAGSQKVAVEIGEQAIEKGFVQTAKELGIRAALQDQGGKVAAKGLNRVAAVLKYPSVTAEKIVERLPVIAKIEQKFGEAMLLPIAGPIKVAAIVTKGGANLTRAAIDRVAPTLLEKVAEAPIVKNLVGRTVGKYVARKEEQAFQQLVDNAFAKALNEGKTVTKQDIIGTVLEQVNRSAEQVVAKGAERKPLSLPANLKTALEKRFDSLIDKGIDPKLVSAQTKVRTSIVDQVLDFPKSKNFLKRGSEEDFIRGVAEKINSTNPNGVISEVKGAMDIATFGRKYGLNREQLHVFTEVMTERATSVTPLTKDEAISLVLKKLGDKNLKGALSGTTLAQQRAANYQGARRIAEGLINDGSPHIIKPPGFFTRAKTNILNKFKPVEEKVTTEFSQYEGVQAVNSEGNIIARNVHLEHDGKIINLDEYLRSPRKDGDLAMIYKGTDRKYYGVYQRRSGSGIDFITREVTEDGTSVIGSKVDFAKTPDAVFPKGNEIASLRLMNKTGASAEYSFKEVLDNSLVKGTEKWQGLLGDKKALYRELSNRGITEPDDVKKIIAILEEKEKKGSGGLLGQNKQTNIGNQRKEYVIGRGDTNDNLLFFQNVSSKHGKIIVDEKGKMFFIDESRNGTEIWDEASKTFKKIDPNKPVPIESGTRLRLGSKTGANGAFNTGQEVKVLKTSGGGIYLVDDAFKKSYQIKEPGGIGKLFGFRDPNVKLINSEDFTKLNYGKDVKDTFSWWEFGKRNQMEKDALSKITIRPGATNDEIEASIRSALKNVDYPPGEIDNALSRLKKAVSIPAQGKQIIVNDAKAFDNFINQVERNPNYRLMSDEIYYPNSQEELNALNNELSIIDKCIKFPASCLGGRAQREAFQTRANRLFGTYDANGLLKSSKPLNQLSEAERVYMAARGLKLEIDLPQKVRDELASQIDKNFNKNGLLSRAKELAGGRDITVVDKPVANAGNQTMIFLQGGGKKPAAGLAMNDNAWLNVEYLASKPREYQLSVYEHERIHNIQGQIGRMQYIINRPNESWTEVFTEWLNLKVHPNKQGILKNHRISYHDGVDRLDALIEKNLRNGKFTQDDVQKFIDASLSGNFDELKPWLNKKGIDLKNELGPTSDYHFYQKRLSTPQVIEGKGKTPTLQIPKGKLNQKLSEYKMEIPTDDGVLFREAAVKTDNKEVKKVMVKSSGAEVTVDGKLIPQGLELELKNGAHVVIKNADTANEFIYRGVDKGTIRGDRFGEIPRTVVVDKSTVPQAISKEGSIGFSIDPDGKIRIAALNDKVTVTSKGVQNGTSLKTGEEIIVDNGTQIEFGGQTKTVIVSKGGAVYLVGGPTQPIQVKESNGIFGKLNDIFGPKEIRGRKPIKLEVIDRANITQSAATAPRGLLNQIKQDIVAPGILAPGFRGGEPFGPGGWFDTMGKKISGIFKKESTAGEPVEQLVRLETAQGKVNQKILSTTGESYQGVKFTVSRSDSQVLTFEFTEPNVKLVINGTEVTAESPVKYIQNGRNNHIQIVHDGIVTEDFIMKEINLRDKVIETGGSKFRVAEIIGDRISSEPKSVAINSDVAKEYFGQAIEGKEAKFSIDPDGTLRIHGTENSGDIFVTKQTGTNPNVKMSQGKEMPLYEGDKVTINNITSTVKVTGGGTYYLLSEDGKALVLKQAEGLGALRDNTIGKLFGDSSVKTLDAVPKQARINLTDEYKKLASAQQKQAELKQIGQRTVEQLDAQRELINQGAIARQERLAEEARQESLKLQQEEKVLVAQAPQPGRNFLKEAKQNVKNWFRFTENEKDLTARIAKQEKFGVVNSTGIIQPNKFVVEVDGNARTLEEHIRATSPDRLAFAYKTTDGKKYGFLRTNKLGGEYMRIELGEDLKIPSSPIGVRSNSLEKVIALTKAEEIDTLILPENGKLTRTVSFLNASDESYSFAVQRWRGMIATDREGVIAELRAKGISDDEITAIMKDLERHATKHDQAIADGLKGLERMEKTYTKYGTPLPSNEELRTQIIDAGYATKDADTILAKYNEQVAQQKALLAQNEQERLKTLGQKAKTDLEEQRRMIAKGDKLRAEQAHEEANQELAKAQNVDDQKALQAQHEQDRLRAAGQQYLDETQRQKALLKQKELQEKMINGDKLPSDAELKTQLMTESKFSEEQADTIIAQARKTAEEEKAQAALALKRDQEQVEKTAANLRRSKEKAAETFQTTEHRLGETKQGITFYNSTGGTELKSVGGTRVGINGTDIPEKASSSLAFGDKISITDLKTGNAREFRFLGVDGSGKVITGREEQFEKQLAKQQKTLEQTVAKAEKVAEKKKVEEAKAFRKPVIVNGENSEAFFGGALAKDESIAFVRNPNGDLRIIGGEKTPFTTIKIQQGENLYGLSSGRELSLKAGDTVIIGDVKGVVMKTKGGAYYLKNVAEDGTITTFKVIDSNGIRGTVRDFVAGLFKGADDPTLQTLAKLPKEQRLTLGSKRQLTRSEQAELKRQQQQERLKALGQKAKTDLEEQRRMIAEGDKLRAEQAHEEANQELAKAQKVDDQKGLLRKQYEDQKRINDEILARGGSHDEYIDRGITGLEELYEVYKARKTPFISDTELRKQISDAGYIVGDADEVFTKFKQRLAEKAQSVAKQPKQLANNQSSQGIGNKIFNIQIAQNILNDSKTPLLNRYARIIQRLGISVLEGINDQLHERGFRWPWEIKPIPLPTPPPSKIVPSLIITPAISPIVKYSSEVTSIVILNAPLPREVSAIPANPQETLIPIKPPGSAAKPPIEQNSISIKNTLNYNQLYLHNCIINNRQSNAGCDINQSLAPGASDVIILACDACHEIDGKDGKCVPIQHQAAWGSGDNTFHSYDIPDGTTRLIIRNMAKKYGISGGGGHDEFCVN